MSPYFYDTFEIKAVFDWISLVRALTWKWHSWKDLEGVALEYLKSPSDKIWHLNTSRSLWNIISQFEEVDKYSCIIILPVLNAIVSKFMKILMSKKKKDTRKEKYFYSNRSKGLGIAPSSIKLNDSFMRGSRTVFFLLKFYTKTDKNNLFSTYPG